MTDQARNNLQSGALLESWKEIAAYLQRDVRTAKRWENLEGLPVHRHHHLSRSSVYAYPSELEAWRANRQPVAEPPRSTWWRPVPAFASVITLALAVMMAGSGPHVGALVQAADGSPDFQKVPIPTAMRVEAGELSPDGQKFAYTSGGSLWVAPLTDGEHRGVPLRLTEPMGALPFVTWSPSAEWIAFRTAPRPVNPEVTDVYVIPSSGGEPQKVVSTKPVSGYYVNRLALSPDGGTVYMADGEPGNRRIYAVAKTGAEKQPVTEPDTEDPAISPDGGKLAYVKMERTDEGSTNSRQVWVKRLDGGAPVLVCEGPPNSRLRSPVWSPDGSKIAILANPDKPWNDTTEIWIVALGADGQPLGSVNTFPLPKETLEVAAGWTNRNQIGLLFKGSANTGLYTVPVTGGQAVQITADGSSHPRWSLDGRTIYYRRGVDGGILRLPADGGKAEELAFKYMLASPGGGLSLSPEGSKLCYAGSGPLTPLPPADIYLVGIAGGEPTRVASEGYAPAWAPDGRQVAFTRMEKTAEGLPVNNLFLVPASGGEPRRITAPEDQVEGFNLDWSPGGDSIAFFGRDHTLRVIPATGGPSRVLASDLGELRYGGVAWSPDGQEIGFTAQDRVWKISRFGGKPEEIRTGTQGTPHQIDWSPDGKRLVFNVDKGGETELWVMENFLPGSEAGQ